LMAIFVIGVLKLEGWGGEGVVFCCKKKKTQGRCRNKGGGEEGRLSSYKLNIIDDITHGIILLVTLLVKISCHHKICLFESHCNILYHSVDIYRIKFSVNVYR